MSADDNTLTEEDTQVHYNEEIGQWVTIDDETGIGAQTDEKVEALIELGQAIAMHYTVDDPDESPEQMLSEFGVTPDDIESQSEPMPEFMK
jgi:hypothetical protein